MTQPVALQATLKGLTTASEQEIAAMSFDQLSELIEDLRQIRSVQEHLPGVRLIDAMERSTKTQRDLVEVVLDIRSVALNTAA